MIHLSNQQGYSAVVDWFTRHKLNEVLDDSNLPRIKIEIYYGKKYVNLGTRHTPESVRFQPTYIKWPDAPYNKLYTLVMIDPDAGEYSQVR